MSAPSSGTRTFHMIEAVADRLEGAPRQLRRRWSDEFKARAVAEALEQARASRRSLIGSHSPVAALWLASCSLRRSEGSTEPARCQVVAASAGEAVIEIVIGDVIVRARADVSEAHLQRVIRAVRRHDPIGVKVFLASHPVDFRKGRTACCRWCGMPAMIRSTARFTSSGPKRAQRPTFCIPFLVFRPLPILDPAVRDKGAGLAVQTRQEFDPVSTRMSVQICAANCRIGCSIKATAPPWR